MDTSVPDEARALYIKAMNLIPDYTDASTERYNSLAGSGGIVRKAFSENDIEYLRVLSELECEELFIPMDEVRSSLKSQNVEDYVYYLTVDSIKVFQHMRGALRRLHYSFAAQLEPDDDHQDMLSNIRDIRVATLTCGETDLELMSMIIIERLPRSSAEFLEFLAEANSVSTPVRDGVL